MSQTEEALRRRIAELEQQLAALSRDGDPLAEERLRAIVAATAHVTYRMSPDWKEMWQLDGRGLLYDAKSPNRNWLQEYIPPEDQPAVMAAVEDAIRERRMFELEHRIRHVDGSVGWTLSRAVPLLTDTGEISEWFGTAKDVSQHRWTQRVLQESEARYRSLFESIDEGFCIVEVIVDAQHHPVDYRFIETNPTFEKQTGLMNAVGRTALELVPDLEPFWFETYGRVALTGEPTRFVNTAEPLGRSFDVYAFRVGSLEELRVAILFRDITTHERAEASLRESESRFRHLADHAPVMVWVTGPDGYCTYLSRSWYEFTGQTEETGLGFGWLDATHPEDQARTEQIFREANGKHQAFRLEYRLRRHDGDYRWAIDAAAPRLGLDGEFLGYVGSVLDITDRKSIEEALRESEAKFRVLTESLPQLVWTCLPDGRCDYLSSQWVAFTGIAMEEQLDMRWLERVIHPEDRERTRDHWLGAVAGHHPYDIEYRIRGADGTYRWFQTRGVPFRDTRGNIIKWFGTCTDIDHQKKTEQELREANRELEEFAYVSSHDLQEPLRMINIYTQLLTACPGRDSDLAKQYAGFIHRGVARMEALIRDLLAFSRIIHSEDFLSGKPDRSADLSAALSDAMTVLKDRIEASGARLEYEDLPSVCGDSTQIAQVFQNLLSNALKYQRSGTRPEIRITAECDSQNCTIAVSDNGIGFEPQFAERIFGLFKRLHNDEYPGTGLGLAICRRIVERYGGRIWAKSTPGAGSIFYFSLPRA